MNNKTHARISEHFSCLQDPRVVGRTDHKLIDIIAITICAVISGANTWVEVELFGTAKMDWLNTFLELQNGIPSHDTFGRVFSLLDTDEFRDCFLSWIASVFQVTGGQVIAIDGKTLRGSYDRSSNKAAIHMVNAWATENGISLGQVKTEDKSNEIKAIPELLRVLELSGCIVTIDAMGCQRDIVKQITDKGADYVLALKGNQGNLYDDVALFYDDAKRNDFKEITVDYHEDVDGGHGRVEVRRCWTSPDIEWLRGKENWQNIKTIGMVESERHVGDKVSTEVRYYISSLDNGAEQFAKAVRGHWGIENALHWRLDVGFREDESRVRKGNAPANFSAVRHIALNLITQERTIKAGTQAKRMRAAWITNTC